MFSSERQRDRGGQRDGENNLELKRERGSKIVATICRINDFHSKISVN